MHFAMRSFTVRRTDAFIYLYLALLLLILPLKWLAAAIIAGAVHEFCHFLAVRLCGGRVAGFRFSFRGAIMEAGGLCPAQELLCVLAGPAGSLGLLLFAQIFPRIAICGGMQGLFNLLPVMPLDGGRVVWLLCHRWLGERTGEKLCSMLEKICLTGLVALGFYGSFLLRLGLMPAMVSIFACYRAVSGKRPCKLGGNSVQ